MTKDEVLQEIIGFVDSYKDLFQRDGISPYTYKRLAWIAFNARHAILDIEPLHYGDRVILLGDLWLSKYEPKKGDIGTIVEVTPDYYRATFDNYGEDVYDVAIEGLRHV